MLKKLDRLFAPVRTQCPVCKQPVRHSERGGEPPVIPLRRPEPRRLLEALCTGCLRQIPWIAYPVCPTCGRHERCDDCVRRHERHFILSRCAVRYDRAMKDWLAQYKYRGNERLEPVIAAMLAFACERLMEKLERLPPGSVITSVPLAEARLRERGFNQAERAALQLSRWYRVPYRPMLSRMRHTAKQSLKSRRSRIVDMKGNFALLNDGSNFAAAATRPPAPGIRNTASPVDGSPVILLVDDIYTTGSTLNECARILRSRNAICPGQPPPSVYGLLWARS